MNDRPTFGSLFAGIGGIDLGLERAGWAGRWQVEYDPFCTRVLARRWPELQRYADIRDVDWGAVEPVDLLAGGFPCQPFSTAGKMLGKADERWLWPEYARAVGVLRPAYVLVENVPGLLGGHGGMGAILGDLAALGYDAEWDSVPASAVGAPHLRFRVWILAYPSGGRSRRPPSLGHSLGAGDGTGHPGPESGGSGLRMAHADSDGRLLQREQLPQDRNTPPRDDPHRGGPILAHPASGRRDTGSGHEEAGEAARRPDGLRGRRPHDRDSSGLVPHPKRQRRRGWASWVEDAADAGERPPGTGRGHWDVEPDVGRVAHGVPSRVDRLRALGNAVVPQNAEAIGRRILAGIGLVDVEGGGA